MLEHNGAREEANSRNKGSCTSGRAFHKSMPQAGRIWANRSVRADRRCPGFLTWLQMCSTAPATNCPKCSLKPPHVSRKPVPPRPPAKPHSTGNVAAHAEGHHSAAQLVTAAAASPHLHPKRSRSSFGTRHNTMTTSGRNRGLLRRTTKMATTTGADTGWTRGWGDVAQLPWARLERRHG